MTELLCYLYPLQTSMCAASLEVMPRNFIYVNQQNLSNEVATDEQEEQAGIL
jgi:hypothetical protein